MHRSLTVSWVLPTAFVPAIWVSRFDTLKAYGTDHALVGARCTSGLYTQLENVRTLPQRLSFVNTMRSG